VALAFHPDVDLAVKLNARVFANAGRLLPEDDGAAVEGEEGPPLLATVFSGYVIDQVNAREPRDLSLERARFDEYPPLAADPPTLPRGTQTEETALMLRFRLSADGPDLFDDSPRCHGASGSRSLAR
jgi:hypothetical protein